MEEIGSYKCWSVSTSVVFLADLAIIVLSICFFLPFAFLKVLTMIPTPLMPSVSAIECLATLCVLAGKGRIGDKVDFLFSLFDLRESGRVSYDEIFILASSVLSGTVKMTGKGHVPDDTIIEKMIDQAFRDAEKDVGATFSIEEYRAWLAKYMDLENEALEVSGCMDGNACNASNQNLSTILPTLRSPRCPMCWLHLMY